MFLGLMAAFSCLAYRLVDLQVMRHDTLSIEARSNTVFTCRLEPKRGDILDSRGDVLATSTLVKTVCANPQLLGARLPDVARILKPYLDMSEQEIEQKLSPRQLQNKKGKLVDVQYVMLKHKVPTETWEKIQQAMQAIEVPGVPRDQEKKMPRTNQVFYSELRNKAVFADPTDEQLRSFPGGNLAAHVLGYVGVGVETNNGMLLPALVGVDGIEKKFDAKLRGARGWRVTERDRQQREMVALREQNVEPRDGLSVVLTIDSVIQQILQEALAKGMHDNAPASISGIVIRPRTGEILGMASLPDFDPNNPGAYPPNALQNRVISDSAEPGSTFKIVVVSGALNDGLVKLTDQFDCEHSHFVYGGKVLHDHNNEGFGVLSVKNIITKSSNIGAAKIGLLMHEPRLYDYIRSFGFGTLTGIPLPNEKRGTVYPLSGWSKLSITRIPMGQELMVTPLQMAMAMSAVANHGVLMQPMLVDRLLNPNGTVAVQYTPQQVRRVISEDASKDMVQALKTVVEAGGTAAKADLKDYTVAGKTGTAQESDKHGYIAGKYYASFIGFFPADNPELCIYVSMDSPKEAGHMGGQTAAPVFHEIAERAAMYLNIRPDKGETNAIPVLASRLGEPAFRTASAHAE